MWILDLFENLRKTETDVKKSKPAERKYDFDAGFSGNKKSDYSSLNRRTPTQKKVQKTSKKTDRDEGR